MAKPRLIRLGVQRVEDPHHPRGYRELRSPAEMRKLLNRKIREQAGICAICHEEFTVYNDVVPDHRNPKGMGGAWRDDHPDNIQAVHWWCTTRRDQREWTADGRLSGQENPSSLTCQVFNDLPRLCFFGCVAKGVVTLFATPLL